MVSWLRVVGKAGLSFCSIMVALCEFGGGEWYLTVGSLKASARVKTVRSGRLHQAQIKPFE